ncbi:MAG: tRNA-(ms[2]io[6]A)-hydroxylase [Planctomycetes bacterium]|nr:tRNA-(ms[2]io[6]A)-hydroxylase [Planctomycetota bacterium]
MPACSEARPPLPPLPYRTPPAWAAAMVDHVPALLVDQAHLEKKAAAAAVAFLFRVPGGAAAQRALSRLAREELVHFERTLRLLSARGVAFVPQPPTPYAERLKAGIGRTMPQRLADELLVAAVIEARSCERMALLGAALRGVDAEVAAFYAELCAAEARHEGLYAALAADLLPPEQLVARWQALGAHEAAVLAGLPPAPRLHAGTGDGG